MHVNRLHHINFIVRDLEAAIERYQALFGAPVGEPEVLPQRGVKLVRFKISETWLVLVQPIDQAGEPARYLEQHGEGFFLVSWQVDDVRESTELAKAQGIGVLNKEARPGLDDWQVVDLAPEDLFGARFQFVQSND